MAEKTKRALTAEEAETLVRCQKRCDEFEGKIRSAAQNRLACQDFVAEAETTLAIPDLPEADRKTLEARLAHCRTEQMAGLSRDEAVSKELLKKARAALSAEKAKFGPTLDRSGDSWYV